MKRLRLVIPLTMLIVACGSDETKQNNTISINNVNNVNNGNNANNGTNQNPADAREQSIVDAFNAPQNTNDAAEGALSLTVESVVTASIEANGGVALVGTGTLTQSGQTFTYSATPTDRLVIDWTEGASTEIFVTAFDGDFEVETVEDFFAANHEVAARVVRDGFVDITVGSLKSGGTVEGGITGDITQDGKTYTVNLTKSGTTVSDVGTTIDYTSESTMSGSITGPDFELVAEEEFYYHHVFVDNNVTNTSRTANSRWTYNGSEYAVNGVLIRTATFDGWPNEDDYWRAEGTITEDGVVVGQVLFDDSETHIDIVLALESGRKILLDRHIKYQPED